MFINAVSDLFCDPTNINHKIVIISYAGAQKYKNITASYSPITWLVQYSFGLMASFCCIESVAQVCFWNVIALAFRCSSHADLVTMPADDGNSG